MCAMKTTTQAEVDSALLKMFGIKPTGKYSPDRTHQIYEDKKGEGYFLPASNQGYSWLSVNDMISHVQNTYSTLNIIDSRVFTTKPDLKIVSPDNSNSDELDEEYPKDLEKKEV